MGVGEPRKAKYALTQRATGTKWSDCKIAAYLNSSLLSAVFCWYYYYNFSLLFYHHQLSEIDITLIVTITVSPHYYQHYCNKVHISQHYSFVLQLVTENTTQYNFITATTTRFSGTNQYQGRRLLLSVSLTCASSQLRCREYTDRKPL